MTEIRDKNTDVKKSPAKRTTKVKINSPPKFKPGDKIELSTPRRKGIEIAKSVREPNNQWLQAGNADEGRPSDGPVGEADKKGRAEAIQRLRSRTARFVAAQDS